MILVKLNWKRIETIKGLLHGLSFVNLKSSSDNNQSGIFLQKPLVYSKKN